MISRATRGAARCVFRPASRFGISKKAPLSVARSHFFFLTRRVKERAEAILDGTTLWNVESFRARMAATFKDAGKRFSGKCHPARGFLVGFGEEWDQPSQTALNCGQVDAQTMRPVTLGMHADKQARPAGIARPGSEARLRRHRAAPRHVEVEAAWRRRMVSARMAPTAGSSGRDLVDHAELDKLIDGSSAIGGVKFLGGFVEVPTRSRAKALPSRSRCSAQVAMSFGKADLADDPRRGGDERR